MHVEELRNAQSSQTMRMTVRTPYHTNGLHNQSRLAMAIFEVAVGPLIPRVAGCQFCERHAIGRFICSNLAFTNEEVHNDSERYLMIVY